MLTNVTKQGAYAYAQVFNEPHLTRVVPNEWRRFVKEWSMQPINTRPRLGACYIERYGMNGFNNQELRFGSDLVAYRMLEGYVYTGKLAVLPTQPDNKVD